MDTTVSPVSSPDRSLADRAKGALLGTFVGDALGMPYEMRAPEDIPPAVEMVEARLGRGTYTDDTQMMIALSESLVACGEVDPDHLARAFADAYDVRRGYGRGTRRVLALWEGGVPVSEAAGRIFDGEGSRGNGAAMRVAPVGVRFHGTSAAVSEQASRSAAVTHAHPVGRDGAVVIAAGVAAAMRGEDIVHAAATAASTDTLRSGLELVRAMLADDVAVNAADAARTLGNGADAAESVPAAVYAAAAHESFEGAVVFAVRMGGDTDTIAAMTGAITGARDGAGTIPQRWLAALEEGQRGRSHVEWLAGRLLQAD